MRWREVCKILQTTDRFVAKHPVDALDYDFASWQIRACPKAAQAVKHRIMGLISRAIDKIVDPLPTWAKGILGLLIVIGFIYGIIHDGFWFLLRVLFAPEF